MNSLRQSGLAESSIRQYWTKVSKCYRDARRGGHFERNWWEDVQAPSRKQQRKGVESYVDGELLAAIADTMRTR